MKRGGPLRRRTGLKAVTPLSPGSSRLQRTPLSPMSKRRRGESQERRDVLDRIRRRDRNRCRATDLLRTAGLAGWEVCDGPLDGHEIVPRSRWRDGYLVDENVILVCRRHHDWIHAHPVTARTLGLLSNGDGFS